MTRRYVTEVLCGALMRMREEMEARIATADDAAAHRRGRGARDAAGFDARVTMAIKAADERVAVFAEVREEALVDRTLEVYAGTEAPIGQGAARLYDELEDMIEQARRNVRLSGRSNIPPGEEREELTTILRRYARTHYAEPHPGCHAHCRCTPGLSDDLSKAVCLRNKQMETGRQSDDIRPDYAYASDEDCLGCVHCIAFSENIRVLDQRTARYAEAAVRPTFGAAQKAAQNKLAALKAKVAKAKEAVQVRGRR